jgi:phenylalanyl-tRNA synthetase alpha chain
MSISVLSARALRSALSLRDLSDPDQGPHAMQLLVDAVVDALCHDWGSTPRLVRGLPLADVSDNYDVLHYSAEAVSRDARYTRYVSERVVLRTHTTAMVPAELRRLASAPAPDVLIACPGICYRRDSIDRLHTGEPHQLDLWRIARQTALGSDDLERMISIVVGTLLPGREHRTSPAVHPYTLSGRQIDVRSDDAWIEIGECGLALPALLAEQGLDPNQTSGLAMGLGLDRILMLRKGIDDIRLLRSTDPRIALQLGDLSAYRVVSRQPAVVRDLSIAVAAEDPVETLGDRVRSGLGADAEHVESVAVVSETPYRALPAAAIARLGMSPEQKNVLVRIVLRRLDRALTHAEANRLRNAIYAALHQGAAAQWATDAR